MTSESGVPQLSEVHIDTDRYVPRRSSISRVVRTLDSSTSPSVVIVHGGPGTGKYSLIRYITSYYSAEKTCVFPDGIHVVPCGKGACVSDRGLYLMHLLGCWPQAGEKEIFGSDKQTAFISFCLKQSLEQRAALIILENVWEPELLKMLVRPGKRCKYLVTAQTPRVCRDAGLDAVVVPIQTINPEDGLRIFFNGLGPAGKELVNSSSSRDAADDVLCAINYNPLIVENLSLVFDHQCRLASAHKPEIAQVNLLKDEFWAELRFESSRVESYPYGFSSSMDLLSSHLSFYEKKLMLMVALFDGMSVPEYVIKILWNCLHDGKVCFETILHRLSSLRLVQTDYDMVPSRKKMIYIHPLRKHYLVHDAPTTPDSFDLLYDLSRAKARNMGFCTEFCLRLCFVYGISSLRIRAHYKLKAITPQTMVLSEGYLGSPSVLLPKRIWLNQILPTLLDAITGTEVSDSKYKTAAEKILSACWMYQFVDACAEEFMVYMQLEKCEWVGLCWVLCVIQFHHNYVWTESISDILKEFLVSVDELSKPAGCHATSKEEIIQAGRNLLEQVFVGRDSRNNKAVRDIVLQLRDFAIEDNRLRV